MKAEITIVVEDMEDMLIWLDRYEHLHGYHPRENTIDWLFQQVRAEIHNYLKDHTAEEPPER